MDTASPTLETRPKAHRPVIHRGRKAGKNSPTFYFTTEVEDAIVEYNNTEDIALRNHIFESKLREPIEKLIENVFHTYKFSYFETDYDTVKDEMLSFVVNKLHLLNTQAGRAYSYFTVAIRNELIGLSNKNYKNFNRHVQIKTQDAIEENSHESLVELVDDSGVPGEPDASELLDMLINFWINKVDDVFRKKRDNAIAWSVVQLMERLDNIEDINAKKVMIYIKEMTGLSGRQTNKINDVIDKMNTYNRKITAKYLNGEPIQNPIATPRPILSPVALYQFIDPEGKQVTTDNLTQFCKDNGLNRRSMNSVNKGKLQSHRGFKKYSPPQSL